MKNKGFKSLSTKLTLIIASIIGLAVLLIFLANSLFLDDFYVEKNKSIFYQEYQDISENFENPDQEILALLREKDKTTGFVFYLVELTTQDKYKIVLSSIPNFLPEPFAFPKDNLSPMIELPKAQFDFLNANVEKIKQDEVVFGKVYRNLNENKEFDLIYAAQLKSPYVLVIARPVEQLEEQTAITNQFLIIIGILSIILSIIIAKFASKSVIKPIKKITTIVEHIAKLDFSHKYEGHTKDEVNLLGNGINVISSQLDSAIKDLEQSNKKLKIEMDLQKRFFAGVSHEFKTPIGLIRGYAESLKLGLVKTPHEIEEFSEIIIEETDKLNHFVTDILFLIKSESTEFVLDIKTLDIITVLENALEKSSHLIEDKEINLIKDISSSIKLYGDEVRIGQVFNNILSNAFRHTPNKGKLIIKAFSKDDGVMIQFMNEGPLIEEKHIKHLFDPFYSAFESRDKINSGTGLGLSIVKNLVEKHKGKCGIENINQKTFKGVNVWVWFPSIKNLDKDN